MEKKIDKEIGALLTLLGDEDQSVQTIAGTQLLRLGAAARDRLLEVAASDDCEGRIRIGAQSLLEQMRLQDLAERFEQHLHSDHFDLERACFILAQIEYSDLSISDYVSRIDRMADEVRDRMTMATGGLQAVETLNEYLFLEKGFAGNLAAYYDPENSYLNRVLDRRLGIPISLSALYMFLANRLDLPVHGIGFPGHFLLKYDDSNERFFIDAFNKGEILARDDCARRLTRQGYDFYDSYLSVSTPKEILARMIRNLVLIYHQNHHPKKIDALEQIFSDFFISQEERLK